MKPVLLSLILSLFSNIAFAQKKEAAEKLVNEGVAYHDKGDYEGAIARYDKALILDKDNLLAMSEKAFTLATLGKNEEAASYCQKAIDLYPGNPGLKIVYVTYGNVLDGMKKTDQSLKLYDDGIKQFPDFYQLHFNKGITLTTVRKYDEAVECFQHAMMANPKHASSHNAMAQVMKGKGERIPALLAHARLLVLEPEGDRAKGILASMQSIMNEGVEKTGKKSVTIKISAEGLSDTTADGNIKENNFTSVELMLSFAAGMDFDKKFKKETPVERFVRKFEAVCATMSTVDAEHRAGFFWDYYAPYFVEMHKKSLVETFGHIAFASSDDKDNLKWIKGHQEDIDKFYDWSAGFKWKQ